LRDCSRVGGGGGGGGFGWGLKTAKRRELKIFNSKTGHYGKPVSDAISVTKMWISTKTLAED